MKKTENHKANSDKDKTQAKGNSEVATALRELFENGLKDIYWAEKALTKALPKMAEKATSSELSEALYNHLEETEEHVSRLEKVFEVIDQKPVAEKCEAMEGLIEEGN